MKKGSMLVILSMLVGLLVLATTVSAAPSSNTNSALLRALRGKQPRGVMVRVGRATSFQPGVSITITTRRGKSITFELTKATKILPASASNEIALDSRVAVFARRDRNTHQLMAFELLELGTRAVSLQPTRTPRPVVTHTPMPTATP